MGYGKEHKPSMCDKCLADVGLDNLVPVPFLYLDHNDKVHKDEGGGYRHYFVCKNCNGKA